MAGRQNNPPLPELDRARAAAEIAAAEGNIVKAAKALGVRPGDLRLVAREDPKMLEASLEQAEAALDKAEAAILRSLRNGPLANRLKAAAWIIRAAARR
jgi:hypothetical protein